MSSNLRNQSYVFKNKQYSREEYFKKIKEYNLSSFETREKLNKEFKELVEKEAVHKYAVNERNVNASGSLLFDCRNVQTAFELDRSENCKYIYGGLDLKDCMDIYHMGYNSELCYEMQGCTRVSNCQFCHLCYDNMNVSYSDTCQNSQNLFGCVSVKKGEYLIFNKKYSKEEYEKLRDRIIEHMKRTGEYGEFFPAEMAPVYYNETQGALYEPMTKEQVLEKGWHWEDNIPGTFGKETIQSQAIPDKIEDVPDSFLKEIFACMDCSKNYNITQNELNFYKKENLPLPRRCPSCRYKRRFEARPLRKLWHRECMCDKNHTNHSGKCKVEFETPYPPERPEKVYCEKCYQQEVY
jgi:hypothetical protein